MQLENKMPHTVSISIDVDNLQRAVDFYTHALGCEMKTKYTDAWSVVSIDGIDIHLQEKAKGTAAAADATRDYARHWTPVHLDFGADDVQAVMRLVEEYGGTLEGYESSEVADIGHCADPFGNGFCLIRESL